MKLAQSLLGLVGISRPSIYKPLDGNDGPPILLSSTVPDGASKPVSPAFISYAIELSHFPDLAGNLSHPNTFTANLLNNLGNITGTKPYVRVGGNTGDYAIFNASLETATEISFDYNRTIHFPNRVQLGKSFFESYMTWPGVKFIHQFNFAYSTSRSQMLESVQWACKALSGSGDDGDERGELLAWELGNEPDLYATEMQEWVRDEKWKSEDYAREWIAGVREIKEVMREECPQMVGEEKWKWWGLSMFDTGGLGRLDAGRMLDEGVMDEGAVEQLVFHKYMGDACCPWDSKITLANTLLDHSRTVRGSQHLSNKIHELQKYNLPFVIGELGSTVNDNGVAYLSNVFGAALWNFDYALHCVSINVSRIHYQQGQFFRYGSFQASPTFENEVGVKAPYYGDVAASWMLRDTREGDEEVRVKEVELEGINESAYVAYVGGRLKRVAVINLREWNGTSLVDKGFEGYGGLGGDVGGDLEEGRLELRSLVVSETQRAPAERPTTIYSFEVDGLDGTEFVVRRLSANGSDALSGITWDGWSYEWPLDDGKPVRLDNVTVGETVTVSDGRLAVGVEWSGAVILEVV